MNKFWASSLKRIQEELPKGLKDSIQDLSRPGLLLEDCLASSYLELACAVAITSLEIVDI